MKSAYLLAVAGAAAIALTVTGLAFAGDEDKGSWGSNVPERCLEIGRIYSWEAAKDDRSLIVESDTHHKYRVELMGYCPGLNFKERVAFRSVGGAALSCLSSGDMVIYRDAGMTQRCYIRKVAPYVPEPEKHEGH